MKQELSLKSIPQVDRVLRELDTRIADMIAAKVTSPNVKIFFGEPKD
jgi:hypothetical protein